MATILQYRFAMRRRLAADWASLNEVLLNSEWGHETDTGFLKVGDGTTAWNDLPYSRGPQGATPGDYGMDAPSLVGYSVNGAGELTAARSVALNPGNGISFDIDPITGDLTISVNGFAADNRVTQDGDTRVTPNGDIRVTR